MTTREAAGPEDRPPDSTTFTSGIVEPNSTTADEFPGELLVRVRRFEWERWIRRAPIDNLTTRAIAAVLSQYANGDGSNARPGIEKLAAVCRADEKTIRRHLQKLRADGYVWREQESNWRWRVQKGIADVYHLTVPVDIVDRPGLLDPNERPP